MEERRRVETKPIIAAAPAPRVREREPKLETLKVEVETKKRVEPKVEVKPQKKVEPKVEVKIEPKIESKIEVKLERKRVSGEIPLAEAPKVEVKPRAKTVPDKYIRFSFEDLKDDNTINTINRQKTNGDIKFAYYATDNDIGYHYYLVIKK